MTNFLNNSLRAAELAYQTAQKAIETINLIGKNALSNKEIIPFTTLKVKNDLIKQSCRQNDLLRIKNNLLSETLKVTLNIEDALEVLQKRSSDRGYLDTIKLIKSSNTFNSQTLYEDVLELFNSTIFTKILKEANFNFKQEPVNINQFLEKIETVQLQNFSCSEELNIDDVNCYISVRELLSNKEWIIEYVQAKAISRYLKNEIRAKRHKHKSHLLTTSPLILNLREFIDNVSSLKKGELLQMKSNSSFTFNKTSINDYSTKNRFIILSN